MGSRIEKKCQTCGKTFLTWPAWVRKTGANFCSRSCGRWKGGRSKNQDGYWTLYLPWHPFSGSSGQVLEHRVVVERARRITLCPWITVHHKNHDKGDNRPENLEVMTSAEHTRRHNLEKWATVWAARRRKPDSFG